MPDVGLRTFCPDVGSHQRSGPELAWPDPVFFYLKCDVHGADGLEKNRNKLLDGDGSLS